MWRIISGDTDFGRFSEAELMHRLSTAVGEGCDVFQVSNNFIISHSNGRIYVATLE